MPEETTLHEGKPFNPYGRFYNAWVPTQLLQSVYISDGAKLAYGLLRKFAGKDGACFPLQSTLARELGCKPRTAHKYIFELKRAGLIRVKSRGRGRSLQYEFLWKKELNSCQLSLPGPHEDAILTNINLRTEEVPLSGSPNRDSSSRACGNVENFDGVPASQAVGVNQEEVGNSEQRGEWKNEEALGGKLARAGWEVLMLGNQAGKDTDVMASLGLRDSIRELAEMKTMKIYNGRRDKTST